MKSITDAFPALCENDTAAIQYAFREWWSRNDSLTRADRDAAQLGFFGGWTERERIGDSFIHRAFDNWINNESCPVACEHRDTAQAGFEAGWNERPKSDF